MEFVQTTLYSLTKNPGIFHQPFLTYLTTRVEGDIVIDRGQLIFSGDSSELMMRGGILEEKECRGIVGDAEGGEICDGKGGAGV